MTGSLVGVASGLYTGASQHIGGSSAYHVDVQFGPLIGGDLSQATEDDYNKIIEIMDTVAESASARGHRVEFSNRAVSGEIWDPDATRAEKRELAERVMRAHGGHSYNTSMDFYFAKDGQSRFDEGIKDYEMDMALAPGWEVKYFSAGNYGRFARVYDEDGNHLYNMGHGSVAKEEPESFKVTDRFLAEQGVSVASNTPFKELGDIPSVWQARRSVEEQGALATYESFRDRVPEGSMEEMFAQLLFSLVLVAAGAEGLMVSPDNQDEQTRRETLQAADAGRDMQRENTEIASAPSPEEQEPDTPVTPDRTPSTPDRGTTRQREGAALSS